MNEFLIVEVFIQLNKISIEVEIDTDTASSLITIILLNAGITPSTEAISIVPIIERSIVVVVRIPYGEISEVLAIVGITEDLLPLRLAGVDTNEFAVIEERVRKVGEELAIPVDVIAPAASARRVVLDVDPDRAVDIVAVTVNHCADEIRSNVACVLSSAWEQVHVGNQAFCLSVLVSSNRVVVHSAVAHVPTSD